MDSDILSLSFISDGKNRKFCGESDRFLRHWQKLTYLVSQFQTLNFPQNLYPQKHQIQLQDLSKKTIAKSKLEKIR